VSISGRASQVVSADGKLVPRARVDFWSRDLPYPYEDLAKSILGGKLSPDGVQHPHWWKADGQGRFEIIVPPGESYLFVNQGTDETVVDRVEATDVGLPDREVRIPSPLSSVLPPRTTAEPHRFYPDRAVRVNYAADTKSDEFTIQLHQKAPTLTVEVVQPDGMPANNLIYAGGQPPFRYYALKLKRLMQKTGVNKFSIPCRDLQNPISLAFLARGSGLGLHTEIAPKDIGDEVVTLKLQRLDQAKARFVDKDHKPLNAFRPLMWMSLASKPLSTAADLEQQTVSSDSRFFALQTAYDSIWTGILHKHTHGSLQTDAEGTATFKALIPGATYRLSQFDGRIRDFTVQAGETVDLGDIVVFEPERTKHLPGAEAPPDAETAAPPEPNEDQATLRGRVLDPGGKPLAGATLWLSTIGRALGQSANDGQFQFRVPTEKLSQLNARGQSESAQLAATADGMGFDFVSVGNAAEGFELKLCKDLPIRGHFVDSEGKPIPGVEIRGVRVFEPGEARLDPFIDHIRSGKTRFYNKVEKFWTGPVPSGPAVVKVDQQGQLSVSGCGAGQFILFEFTAAGIADDSVYVLTHDAEPIRFKPSRFGIRLMPRLYYGATFTHVATPSRRINGVVLDKETNKPIAGATVHHQFSFGTSSKTDAEGRYVLEGHLKSAGYRVGASAGFPYFSSSHGVQDTGGLDPVTVDVYLPRGIGAHGKILDAATGDPIAGQVQYYPLFRDSPISSGLDFPATGTVEADGSFKLPVLSGPGVLAVRAAEVDAYLSSDLTTKRIDDFFNDGHERVIQERLVTAGPEGSIGIPLAPSVYNSLILINPKGDQQEVVNDIRLERPNAGG
jgi:hypothetical protein